MTNQFFRRGFITGPLVAGVFFMSLLLAATYVNFISRSATLLFKASGSRFVAQGEQFSVALHIDTPVSINTITAIVHYPPELLEVSSFSTSESIIDLWVEEPTVSSATGIIRFGGGRIEGFRGRGTLFVIQFTARYAGEAVISYADGSVLASDGKGSEVLGRLRDVSYLIHAHNLDTSAVYDLDGDGRVGLSDLSIFLAHMF